MGLAGSPSTESKKSALELGIVLLLVRRIVGHPDQVLGGGQRASVEVGASDGSNRFRPRRRALLSWTPTAENASRRS